MKRCPEIITICMLGLLLSSFVSHIRIPSLERPVPVGPYELNYPAYFGSRFKLPEDRPLTRQEVHLGRMLFYETRLSANDQLSCSSCHIQQLAFTDGKRFSTGVDGTLTRRNAMSLSNLLWVRDFFWDGRVKGLEEQAVFPLTDPHEMGQGLEESARKLQSIANYPKVFELVYGDDSITGDRIAMAIAQFERTLISSDSPYDRYLAGNYKPSDSELRGEKFFSGSSDMGINSRGANCTHCHSLPKTFSGLFHNNGLDSVAPDHGRQDLTGSIADHGRFRVPTLRNIALTAPYMHDGRFETLREVLDHYSDHIQQSPFLSPFIENHSGSGTQRGLLLSDQEKEDLLAFLNMLTDQTFIHNAEFSNPHQ